MVLPAPTVLPRAWPARGPLLLGIAAVIVLCAGFGTWAVFANISGAIIAPGQIEVDRNRQVIQHPDGGVVDEVLVDEGQSVIAGDVLLRLDATLQRSEFAIIEGQLFELMARRARLEAERDGHAHLTFADELHTAARTRPDVQNLMDGQNRLFTARRATTQRELEQLRNRSGQIETQITGIAAQTQALQTQIQLLSQELQNQQALLDKGLAQAAPVLALQRRQAELQGTIGQLAAQRGEAAERISEIELEIVRARTKRREEAITALRELQVSENSTRERRRGLTERLARMDITAPVSGVVYGLKVFAKRSVVRPADPLMFLVPQDRPLIIASRIEPIHIDQVFVGQEVLVRLSAFDQRSTPELVGQLVQLSADAFQDQSTQASFYRAEVVLKDGELSKLPDGKPLIPGMPVESYIKTEDRTLLTYLVKPLADYFARAFRES